VAAFFARVQRLRPDVAVFAMIRHCGCRTGCCRCSSRRRAARRVASSGTCGAYPARVRGERKSPTGVNVCRVVAEGCSRSVPAIESGAPRSRVALAASAGEVGKRQRARHLDGEARAVAEVGFEGDGASEEMGEAAHRSAPT